jgi:hypothetical protein
MGDERLTSRKRGLGGTGFGDFFRESAPRCTNSADLECHHKLTTGGSGIDNAQILCKPCHAATESYGRPGISPAPFDQAVKDYALLRCGRRCECTKTHTGHGYTPAWSTAMRSGSSQR